MQEDVTGEVNLVHTLRRREIWLVHSINQWRGCGVNLMFPSLLYHTWYCSALGGGGKGRPPHLHIFLRHSGGLPASLLPQDRNACSTGIPLESRIPNGRWVFLTAAFHSTPLFYPTIFGNFSCTPEEGSPQEVASSVQLSPRIDLALYRLTGGSLVYQEARALGIGTVWS